MTIRETIKRIPTRAVRLLQRIADLKRGRYMLLLTIGDDTMEWTICPIEKIER
jgi:hypothetical protein